MSLRRPPSADMLAALALTVAVAVEAPLSSHTRGPAVLNVLAAVLLAGPVAFRRTAPASAFGAFAAGAVVWTAFLTEVQALQSVILCLILMSYGAGRVLPAHRAAAVGLGGVTLVVVVSLLADLRGVGDTLFPSLFFVLAPLAAGAAVQGRARLVRELADKSARLERDREERARSAVAEERTRIARELHDLVAHSVSTMVIQAGAGRRTVASDPERARGTALLIETSGREALTELRRLLGVLRRGDEELALVPQPTLARVGRLVANARAAGLRVELRIEGEPAPLPKVVDLAAYRVVQEALTNAIQHAGPASATVLVRYRNEEVQVEVADTGAGPHPGDGDGRDGHGLVGMRERVALVGGELEVGRRRGGGFAVRARLPLEWVAV